MGIIRFIVSFVFCFSVLLSLAQKKYDVEVNNGKKYYVFIVERGNTLYSITREFKISESDLKSANPGLSTELTLGQKILVPVDKSGYKQSEFTFKKHTVEKGETFYGLSRKFGVSIEDIKGANPGLIELKNGEEINIPVKNGESIQKDPVENHIDQNLQNDQNDNQVNQIEENANQIVANDSIIEHKVLAHETLYSIARRYMVSVDTIKALNDLQGNALSRGQVLKIPIEPVKVREVLNKDVPKEDTTFYEYGDSKRKDAYNVTILLPFFFDQNASHLASGSLSSPKEILPKTKIALDFYMGVKMALDSLEKAGVNLNVQIFDTRGDSTAVAKILKDQNVDQADLIIGPFYKKPVALVAQFAKEHQIHNVIPFSASGKVLYGNPYVSKFIASNGILIKGTVEYIKDHYPNQNVILIKSTTSKDDYAYQKTREFLEEFNISYTEKALSTTDMGSYFKKNDLNIVLAPSANQIFANNLFVGLNKTMNKFGYRDSTVIHLFGTDNWERFEGIKMKYKTRMNFHYASPIYADWKSEKTKLIVKDFRSKFETDPTEYSLHGFDLTMYYISGLELFGTGFFKHFDQIQTDPVVNRISINQLGNTNGFENSSYFILRYLPTYQKILTK
ncbi:MAG: LysM peptidoglycan-binding domain-containing protein [Crocinitomicaceae bacterium]|nr:LysM peptidoglycan-binding domain-containing protein [Crocinitomicaceae bacterium]